MVSHHFSPSHSECTSCHPDNLLRQHSSHALSYCDQQLVAPCLLLVFSKHVMAQVLCMHLGQKSGSLKDRPLGDAIQS